MGDWFLRNTRAENLLREYDFDLTYVGVDITPEQTDRLRQVLISTVSGDMTPFQAMREITKLLGKSAEASDPVEGISYQAERILRKETNRAYSTATHSQQRNLAEQVPGLLKGWMATGDNRTRDSHLAAHGQVVPTDKPFIVGGAKLMYPGDPAGPPEETINCRCRLFTVIPEIGLIETPLDAKIKREMKRRTKQPKDAED